MSRFINDWWPLIVGIIVGCVVGRYIGMSIVHYGVMVNT